MQTMLIIAAVPRELSALIRSSGAGRMNDRIFPHAYEGRIDNCRLLLVASGMGKVNAASAASAFIREYSPQLVINTGCGGAYPESGLQTGDLALASSELFGDEGVLTVEGWKSLEFIGIPVLEKDGDRYFNEIPLSASAAEQAMRLAFALGQPLRSGRFVTVSTCSGTTVSGAELYRRTGGICENMEGAAVAQVAAQYGVDCLEIRGISNMVEDRDLAKWDIPLAVELAQSFVLRYIEHYAQGRER